MSATLDLQPLARLLDDAPIVAAAARSYEVATHYVARRAELNLEQQTAQVLRAALERHDGDILCFLPGAAEIGRVQRALEDSRIDSGVRVLPLYGELAGDAQDAALGPMPEGQRKIVLATTIAETSLTIEGIRVVVDSGVRRYAQFDPATGMSRLVTGKISQAAADQRRGRAGRLSAGYCYRLWSEGTHASLAAQTRSRDPACRSRAACARAQLLGRPGRRPAALARSAARRSARAGARSIAAARGDRRRGANHGAWPRSGAGRRSSAVGAYAGQGTRLGRATFGLRSCRHPE